jgi:GNAT superfamily N-acetyltransferase
MSELELAARLRDLHPPAEPPWWPPAPGWWIAALTGAILVALAIGYALPRWRSWRLRRRLLAALEAIALRHRAGALATATAAEVSQLLRRAALECFPQSRAAGLHGEEWIAFLERCDKAPGRFRALHEALSVAPYARPGSSDDASALLLAARGWLRAVT